MKPSMVVRGRTLILYESVRDGKEHDLDKALKDLGENDDIKIEMRQCDMITSYALSVMINAMQRLDNRGRVLILVNPSPSVRHLLDVIAVRPCFDIKEARGGI